MTTYQTNARILGEIANLQAKVNHLKNLLAFKPFKKGTFFFYGNDGTFIGLEQSHLPFDMGTELEILLNESITWYQDQIIELSKV